MHFLLSWIVFHDLRQKIKKPFLRPFPVERPVNTPCAEYAPAKALQHRFPENVTILAGDYSSTIAAFCETNGYKSGDFFKVLDQFVADMKSC